MNKSEFFNIFLGSSEVTYSGFWVQSARLSSYVEPANHSHDGDEVNISSLVCRSEVNVIVTSKGINHCFVFNLEVDSKFEELIGKSQVSIGELNPRIYLNKEVEEGYSGDIYSDDENQKATIDELLVGYRTCGSCGSTKHDNRVSELQLRRASTVRLNKQLKTDIESGVSTALTENILFVINQGLEQSVLAVNSVQKALAQAVVA